MRELFRNAWLGWGRYTENGKFAALLLAVLLIFWLLQRAAFGDHKKFLGLMVYTSFMTVACICPVTAVCFMLYQTRFYDYEWIWSLVPVTAVIAAGGTVFLEKIWEDYSHPKEKRYFRASLFTAALVLLIFFSGSLDQKVWNDGVTGSERAQVEAVLERLMTEQDEEGLCLWAPREVLECARAYSGEIFLLYGRDMWDGALGAYTYEVYDETRRELYLWMDHAEESGSLVGIVEVLTVDEAGEQHNGEKQLDGIVCIQDAINMGANRILLPGNMQEEDLEQIEKALSVEAEELGGYILLRLGK
ncbi:MAG: hypothetical protein J1E64_00110 [Acetatifactor sp.]|nr:hypothetical protein [Acetatifactor sp.]